MRIKIVGDGAWGRALCRVIRENSHAVSFITKPMLEQKTISVKDTDALILAVPTQSIRSVLERINGIENKIIINCAKGIERLTHKFPFQIVSEKGGKKEKYFTLMGPSFAKEVEEKMPTVINLGHNSQRKYINSAKKIFENEYFEVKVVHGIAALELAGAFKNIYAIACGITTGVGFGMNTRVKVILAGLKELHGLMKSLKFRAKDETIPAILGDLMLTCNSMESRNFTFGNMLTNFSAEESLSKINATVEGFYTADSVEYFVEKSQKALPLAQAVVKCIKTEDKQELRKIFVKAITNMD